jgi:hypothetical protein
MTGCCCTVQPAYFQLKPVVQSFQESKLVVTEWTKSIMCVQYLECDVSSEESISWLVLLNIKMTVIGGAVSLNKIVNPRSECAESIVLLKKLDRS